MDTGIANPRRPWIAAVLSLLCTGLGHIYCGRFLKGIVLFAISISTAPLIFLAALCGAATLVLVGMVLACGLTTAICLYAVVDSVLVARRTGSGFQPWEYNNEGVYCIFILLSLTIPVGTAAYIKANVFEAFQCPSESMFPTIIPGDRFLVNKTVYNPSSPERGEIVVFRNPDDRKINYIKRVIGVSGDTVAVQDNEVFLNGTKLVRQEKPPTKGGWLGWTSKGSVCYEANGENRYLIVIDPEAAAVEDFPETTVPRGHCFVLGDNRNGSRDSRHFGVVPLGDVVGRVQYMYFPAMSWSRFGAIEN